MNTLKLTDLIDKTKCTRDLHISKLQQPATLCLTCGDGRLYCRACTHPTHKTVSLGLQKFQCERDARSPSNSPISDSLRQAKFCWCNLDYKEDDQQGDMWQCLGCDDWFHVECVREDLPWILVDTPGNFVCRKCHAQYPAFGGCGNVASSAEMCLVLPPSWRPCECPPCSLQLKAPLDPEYFLLEDDEPHSESDLDDAGLDKQAWLRTIEGYHMLKRKLSAFLRSFPADHVITAEDIDSFHLKL